MDTEKIIELLKSSAQQCKLLRGDLVAAQDYMVKLQDRIGVQPEFFPADQSIKHVILALNTMRSRFEEMLPTIEPTAPPEIRPLTATEIEATLPSTQQGPDPGANPPGPDPSLNPPLDPVQPDAVGRHK